MTDMARSKAARGTEVSAQADRRAAIGKYKIITRESSEVFVVTAAVCCALRILGRAENASVARRPPCVNLYGCGYAFALRKDRRIMVWEGLRKTCSLTEVFLLQKVLLPLSQNCVLPAPLTRGATA